MRIHSRAGPRAILLLALVTCGLLPALGALPIPGGDPCGNACEYKRIPEPTEPSNADTGTAAAAISKLMVDAVFEVGGEAIGGIGGKLFSTLGLGLFSGVFEEKAPTPAWQEYQLQKALGAQTDYLACKVDALQSQINEAADQRMQQADLLAFNEALQAIQSAIAGKCGGQNCLNVTNLPPSQRNAAVGGEACADQSSFDFNDCAAVKTWNPLAPTPCRYDDKGGMGVCDPATKRCWKTRGAGDVSGELADILDMFLAKDSLNDFVKFNAFYDPAATLALAKGSLLKLMVYQQALMLNGAAGLNGEYKAFAARVASYLESRVDYTLNVTRLEGVVNRLYVPNTHLDNFVVRPEINNEIWPVMPTDVERVNTDRQGACICTKKKKAFFGKDPPDSSDVWFNTPADGWHLNINVLARSSCLPQDTRMERLANKCFINIFQCGRTNLQGPGLNILSDGECPAACAKIWQRCIDGVGLRKVGKVPRDYFANYVGPLAALPTGGRLLRPDACPTLAADIQALVHADALKLQAQLRATLAPVTSIIADLKTIAATGMDSRLFGTLKTRFPLMACNGGATFKQQAGPAAALVARPGAAAAGTIQRKACQVAHCAVCSPPWVCRQCQPGFMRSTRGTQCRPISAAKPVAGR